MIFKNLEEKFGTIIPVEFKLFQKLIELNNPIIEYFDPIENFSFRLTKWITCNDIDVRVDEFFTSSSLEKYWSRQMEIWGSLDYLPFGLLVKPHAGLLLYKNSPGKVGAIYYTETGSREPLYLSADLCSFVESLKNEYRDDKKSMLSKLYKNWEEDFWREKDEKE